MGSNPTNLPPKAETIKRTAEAFDLESIFLDRPTGL